MISLNSVQLMIIIMLANGAILAFILVISGIITKKNPNQAMFFLCITLLQIISLLIFIYPDEIHLKMIHIVLLFLFYPLLYYYFEKLLNAQFYLNRVFFINLIPAFFVAILFIVFAMKNTNINGQDISSQHNYFFLRYIIAALLIVYIYYSVNIELNLLKYWKSAFSNTIFILMALFFLDIFIFSSLVIAGYLYNHDWIEWGHLLLSFIVLILHLINTRYPIFLENIKNNKSYQKSRIKNLEVDKLEMELINLFEKEKIFLDESISLEKLAFKVNISIHQLSEFINSNWHISFFNLINRYRVREAQKILMDNPDENILHIAFQVGFNNKASFNAAFKKFTGKTPITFRRNPTLPL